MYHQRRRLIAPAAGMLFVQGWLLSPGAAADGITIDRVYDPYVQLLEKEIEYRLLHVDDAGTDNDFQRHRLGIGHSLSDRLAAEVYLTGLDLPGSRFSAEAVEVELKWQLTEQGEFNNDWGLLFELEREVERNVWEYRTTVIGLHEWSQWIGKANFSLAYEWGEGVHNEWETAFAGQMRYRYLQGFEPALELYVAQQTKGLGPVLTGIARLGGMHKLKWEIGVIFGLDDKTADANWKLNLDYEF